MMPRVHLDPRAIIRTMTVALIVLCVGHLLTQYAKYRLGVPHAYGLVPLFDMDVETNLPSLFAGLQLLFCSLALALIGSVRRQMNDPYARHWLILSVIFLMLAVDELVGIHELTIRMGWDFAPSLASGAFFFAWVIPALVLVGVVALCYVRFVFSYLPPVTRRRTVVGAALFVGGALGVEMFEGRHVQVHGMQNLTMGLYVFFEETMEKAGILVFLSGLLEYLRSSIGGFLVDVTGTKNEEELDARSSVEIQH